jgi:hypothetical protein
LTLPPGASAQEEEWGGANDAKASKLKGRSLERRARAQGLELRHAASGYALIDETRKPIHDRRDMTLDEVAAWLKRK